MRLRRKSKHSHMDSFDSNSRLNRPWSLKRKPRQGVHTEIEERRKPSERTKDLECGGERRNLTVSIHLTGGRTNQEIYVW